MTPALGGLLRGLGRLSTQGSLQANAAAVAAVQWPSMFQAAHLQPQRWLPLQQLQQHHSPGSSRSLSFLSSAPALQHQSLTAAAAAGPIQQQPQTQPLSLWRQLQRQQQQLDQPQLLQLPGQQVRHFVLMPRRIKYRKAHKSMGFNETICGNTRQLAFGLYGIRALEHCRIPASTIEAVRRTMRRTIKKSAMLWIRVTPNVPVTSKPAEVRMGKGKGTLDYWAAPIRAGQIIFEFDRCSKATALQAVQSIKAKMPIKIDFVEWN